MDKYWFVSSEVAHGGTASEGESGRNAPIRFVVSVSYFPSRAAFKSRSLLGPMLQKMKKYFLLGSSFAGGGRKHTNITHHERDRFFSPKLGKDRSQKSSTERNKRKTSQWGKNNAVVQPFGPLRCERSWILCASIAPREYN